MSYINIYDGTYQEYPNCKTLKKCMNNVGNPNNESCHTEITTDDKNNYEIPNMKYILPDGRCFKTKSNSCCWGCLNVRLDESYDDSLKISDTDNLLYESCVNNIDSRIKYGEWMTGPQGNGSSRYLKTLFYNNKTLPGYLIYVGCWDSSLVNNNNSFFLGSVNIVSGNGIIDATSLAAKNNYKSFIITSDNECYGVTKISVITEGVQYGNCNNVTSNGLYNNSIPIPYPINGKKSMIVLKMSDNLFEVFRISSYEELGNNIEYKDYPKCKMNGTCTSDSNGVMKERGVYELPNVQYLMSDGRCFKSKSDNTCAGCLDVLYDVPYDNPSDTTFSEYFNRYQTCSNTSPGEDSRFSYGGWKTNSDGKTSSDLYIKTLNDVTSVFGNIPLPGKLQYLGCLNMTVNQISSLGGTLVAKDIDLTIKDDNPANIILAAMATAQANNKFFGITRNNECYSFSNERGIISKVLTLGVSGSCANVTANGLLNNTIAVPVTSNDFVVYRLSDELYNFLKELPKYNKDYSNKPQFKPIRSCPMTTDRNNYESTILQNTNDPGINNKIGGWYSDPSMNLKYNSNISFTNNNKVYNKAYSLEVVPTFDNLTWITGDDPLLCKAVFNDNLENSPKRWTGYYSNSDIINNGYKINSSCCSNMFQGNSPCLLCSKNNKMDSKYCPGSDVLNTKTDPDSVQTINDTDTFANTISSVKPSGSVTCYYKNNSIKNEKQLDDLLIKGEQNIISPSLIADLGKDYCYSTIEEDTNVYCKKDDYGNSITPCIRLLAKNKNGTAYSSACQKWKKYVKDTPSLGGKKLDEYSREFCNEHPSSYLCDCFNASILPISDNPNKMNARKVYDYIMNNSSENNQQIIADKECWFKPCISENEPYDLAIETPKTCNTNIQLCYNISDAIDKSTISNSMQNTICNMTVGGNTSTSNTSSTSPSTSSSTTPNTQSNNNTSNNQSTKKINSTLIIIIVSIVLFIISGVIISLFVFSSNTSTVIIDNETIDDIENVLLT